MFSYQQSFHLPTKEVTPERFWALVGAPFTKECVTKFRQTGDASWKRKLPAFIFQATFDVTKSKNGYEGTWRKQAATRLNGLCVLDVDHVDHPVGVFNRFTERLFRPPLAPPDSGGESGSSSPESGEVRRGLNDLGILLIYVTPSGHGLKVVFKADAAKGNLIDNMLAMAKVLGVVADESCKDASRMSFVCTKEDILYINEEELFTYENPEFAEKYNDQYRRGNSRPTVSSPESGEVRRGLNAALQKDGQRDFRPPLAPPDSGGESGSSSPNSGGELRYGGWTGHLDELLKAYYGEKPPGPAEKGGSGLSRHTESLKWAYDLLVMTGRNKQRTEQLLRQIPWVQDIVSERCENVTQTVDDADGRVREREQKYGAGVKVSKRMQAALAALVKADAADTEEQTACEDKLPLEEWGQQIEDMFDDFPCLREVCQGQKRGVYPACLFVSAAFLGTLMTRCTWHHWYEPEKVRRLNYSVIIIGPPTSGKNFADRLYRLLAAPIKVSDKVGYDAINRWKEDKSAKADNKEKPKKPQVIIRDHPARTANGVFITDMVNAVEVIDGEELNLHMLTFDSELDNATLMQRGGQWIDKTSLELKAFHNEEDGQAYGNLDSVSGLFKVYWNYVYTGTPLALDRKVNERNFGTGLATRLGVVPMPEREFKLAEYGLRRKTDQQADELLKTWAFRLDKVEGELPIEPLLRATYEWQSAQMEQAAFDVDKALDMLMMRVPYYGIGISVPYIVMRHWDEWQEHKTLTLDDRDVALCRLAMDIQYRCQQYFFYAYAKAYFENLTRDRNEKRRTNRSRYDQAFRELPQEFTLNDIHTIYGISKEAASTAACRLCDHGFAERLKHGKYRKLKKTLI